MQIIEPDPQYLITTKPSSERYENAFATPFERSDGTIRGALYNAEGALIVPSQRVCGVAGDRVRLSDPDRISPPATTRRVEGVGCYLGHIMNHYGHLITEGLSAAWELGNRSYDYYAFHPFIFGSGITEIVTDALSMVGVERSQIIIIRETTRFDNIIVPVRSWVPNVGAHLTMNSIFDRIAGPYAREDRQLKLYLSRREVKDRAISNEGEIERIFQRSGFLVVHPELIPWREQLILYGAAHTLAGFGGSALHNILFCAYETRLVVLGDHRSPTRLIPAQSICSALRRTRAVVIPFSGTDEGFDLENLAGNLAAAMEAL